MALYFQNKTCVIVSKHQKEEVIAPILAEMLGLKFVYGQHFDTDSLGTFSGEVERIKDPLNTVKDKCMLGNYIPNVDFIIANEGSFGPHPFIPFVKADEEYICIYDKKENDYVTEKMIFFETNFSSETITNLSQLDAVLEKIKYPTHGVILRFNNIIIKDVQDLILIRTHVQALLEEYGQCTIETDMRAMYNPTRMQCISQLTKKLGSTLLTECDHCGWHGFKIVQQEAGLKCSLCNRPTKSTLSHLYHCKKCGFEKKKLYPNNKQLEDPTYCDWCNP